MAYGFGQAGEFFKCLALDLQRDQCGGNLRVGGFRIKQRVEQLRRLSAQKIFTTHQTRQESAKSLWFLSGCTCQRLLHHRDRRDLTEIHREELCGSSVKPLCLCGELLSNCKPEC